MVDKKVLNYLECFEPVTFLLDIVLNLTCEFLDFLAVVKSKLGHLLAYFGMSFVFTNYFTFKFLVYRLGWFIMHR